METGRSLTRLVGPRCSRYNRDLGRVDALIRVILLTFNKGLSIAGLVGVVGCAVLVWLRMDALGFEGGDGKTFQTYVLSYLRYAPLFQVNILSPLQGAFGPQLPINTWLNPGYVVFRLFDRDAAIVASLVASFLALAIPTYFLALASGL